MTQKKAQLLADDVVTTAKIAAGAVTTAKLATDAVTAAVIADGTITANKIADGAVTSGKLANLGVITGKIDDLAVTTAKLNDLAVTTAKLNDGAVTSAKLAAGAFSLNNTTYIGSGTGAVSRNAQDKVRDYPTVKDYGATGDGITDDRSACLAMETAVGYTVFVNGTFRLSSNTTFLKPVTILPGAQLYIPNGVTVTFGSALNAGVYKIFTFAGTGKIAQMTLSGSNQPAVSEGYPEWWGAVPNSSGSATANLTAISSAIKTLPTTIFQAAAYYISGTLEITDGLRTLQGYRQSEYNSDTGSQTRLVVTSGSADVVRVYTPGSVSYPSWNQRVTINDMQLARSVVPVVPASGNEINGPAGIRIEQMIWVFLNRVTLQDHFIGALLNGTIRVTMNQVLSQRINNGTGATANDKTYHFWLNGYASFGLAGGNASTYMMDCTAGGFPPAIGPNGTIGLYLPGAYVDTFIRCFETTQMGYGIYMDASGLTSNQQKTGCADVHIERPIIDAFTQAAIYIKNNSAYGAIDIVGGYCAASGGYSPSAGIHIDGGTGLISITNFQTIAWPAASCRGLYIMSGGQGVTTTGMMIVGSQRPVELSGASRCHLQVGIKNNTGETTTQAAVLLTNSSNRCYIQPTIFGSSGVFTAGVNLSGSGNDLIEVNCTTVDSSAISGGTSNLMLQNGNSRTAPGTYTSGGTLLVSGLVA